MTGAGTPSLGWAARGGEAHPGKAEASGTREGNSMGDRYKKRNDQIYSQLKARYLAKPDSLSRGEKEALVMATFLRFIELNDKAEPTRAETLEWLWAGLTRCQLMIDQYEKGTYRGDFEEDYLSNWNGHPSEAEQVAHRYRDRDAFTKMYPLDARYRRLAAIAEVASMC